MFALIKTETKERDDGQSYQVRTYRNDRTGREITTFLLRKDANHEWWTFEDLFGLPFTRSLAANNVVRLFGHGLQLADLKAHNAEIRAIARSTDPEKIDRIIAKTYEHDTLTETMADPVRQCIGLCTLYLLLDDERPDAYVQGIQNLKASVLTLDIEAQTFFLSWWGSVIERYGMVLKTPSPIVSRATS